MSKWYLKVRNNINLEGDIQLAEREIKHLFGESVPIYRENVHLLTDVCPKTSQISNSRKSGVIGYLVSKPFASLERIVTLLSFTQEIWFKKTNNNYRENYAIENGNFICIVPYMALAELLFYSTEVDKNAVERILFSLAYGKENLKSINRSNTSSPHLHSFHVYKAKFFPRFVRSLIVSNIDIQNTNIKICDPYVGSGTTLIEGALMGFETYGIDIDPLSCFISETKAKAIDILPELIEYPCNEGLFNCMENNISYEFPDIIRKKFHRWGAENEMINYEKQISLELSKILNTDTGYYKILHEIALSDALTKKFNIRMLGTGSGRFALEIAKTELSSLIKNNLSNEIKAIKTIQILKDIYIVHAPQPMVTSGDATKRIVADSFFDIIITSPPYIPASSGREDYLIGKLISIKALDLYDEENAKFCAEHSVGSINSNEECDLMGLPQSVAELYDWLVKDELRCIKAKPIVAYYQSIKKSLMEDARTIKQNGKIIYIIGKETIFYSSSTKEILYKVNCDSIFIEIAKSVGLEVEEVIDIELDKKNKIARPRGLDKYYECAIIMSRK